MRRSPLYALLALWPAAAFGQTVFFDDFDGDELLPHWRQPPPTDWEYNVSGGMLNITRVLYPSHPHSPSNYAVLSAPFATQADFRIDVWMGWEEPTAQFHESKFSLVTPLPGTGIVATFGYSYLLGDGPEIVASAGGGGRRVPAPPPGNYQFTIARSAGQFEFHLDGELFAVLPDVRDLPVGQIYVFFSTPYPGDWGGFHIDRVEVVPAPGPLTLALVMSLACAGARRRRARCAP